MSLYDDTNPSHVALRERMRETSKSYDQLPQWTVTLHINPRRTWKIRAANMDAAHRLAEKCAGCSAAAANGGFHYGATIVAGWRD